MLKRVSWLVGTPSFQSESTRYRCVHIAANLFIRGYQCSVFANVADVKTNIDNFDCLVVVGYLNPDVVSVAVDVRTAGKQVFVDVADDIFLAKKNTEGWNSGHSILRTLSTLVNAFVCSGVAMREWLQNNIITERGPRVEVVVIEDCTETEEVYSVSAGFWTAATGQRLNLETVDFMADYSTVDHRRISLLWFEDDLITIGDCDLMNLVPVIEQVNQIQNRDEVFLHIVCHKKNNQELLRQSARFSIEFHEWSRKKISQLLKNTQFALITARGGLHGKFKSPRNILRAMHLGVPVLVDPDMKSAAEVWQDQGEIPWFTDLKKILAEVEETGYQNVRQRMLAAMLPYQTRCRIEKTAAAWESVLDESYANNTTESLLKRVLHVYGSDEDLEASVDVKNYCINQDVEFFAISSVSVLRARKNMLMFLGAHRIKLGMVLDDNNVMVDMVGLYDSDLVIMNSIGGSDIEVTMRRFAREKGVRILSQAEFRYLSKFNARKRIGRSPSDLNHQSNMNKLAESSASSASYQSGASCKQLLVMVVMINNCSELIHEFSRRMFGVRLGKAVSVVKKFRHRLFRML